MAIVGIPAAGIGIGYFTLLQTAVADAYRGRVFGAQRTNQALTGLIGAGLAGVLGDLVGIVLVLNVQGAAYLLAGVLVLVALRGAVRRPAGEPGAREEAALPG